MPADLDLALRVRADMQGALQGVRGLNRRLGETARQGGEAGVALQGAAGAAQAFSSSLGTLGSESESALGGARSAVESAFGGMEDALLRFVTTGKLSVSSLADSIIADLARIAIQQAITLPLAGALFGLFPGTPVSPAGGAAPALPSGVSLFGGVAHAGGVAGRPGGVRRLVPPEIFAGAPRFHSGGIAGLQPDGGIAGLRPDEVPIIAERGERILPRGASVSMPPIEINFHNEGTPQREVRREVRLDPRGVIVTVVTDDLVRGGPIRQTLAREGLGGGLP